jgi:hypothetical protein
VDNPGNYSEREIKIVRFQTESYYKDRQESYYCIAKLKNQLIILTGASINTLKT